MAGRRKTSDVIGDVVRTGVREHVTLDDLDVFLGRPRRPRSGTTGTRSDVSGCSRAWTRSRSGCGRSRPGGVGRCRPARRVRLGCACASGRSPRAPRPGVHLAVHAAGAGRTCRSVDERSSPWYSHGLASNDLGASTPTVAGGFAALSIRMNRSGRSAPSGPAMTPHASSGWSRGRGRRSRRRGRLGSPARRPAYVPDPRRTHAYRTRLTSLPHSARAPPRLEITYCTQCRWLLRAGWTAQELLTTFPADLGEVALVPGTGGVFPVRLDDDVLWDRASRAASRSSRLKQLVRDRVAPDRSLGHSEQAASAPPSATAPARPARRSASGRRPGGRRAGRPAAARPACPR